MTTTIPDLALALVSTALDCAPPSPTVLVLTVHAPVTTLLRQLGTIAGIASERARAAPFAPDWAGVEEIALLACFAIEKDLGDDIDAALRMIRMASDRLVLLRAAATADDVRFEA